MTMGDQSALMVWRLSKNGIVLFQTKPFSLADIKTKRIEEMRRDLVREYVKDHDDYCDLSQNFVFSIARYNSEENSND